MPDLSIDTAEGDAEDTAENQTAEPSGAVTVRLDKWLWAARFFKTRGLATEAVHGGKVQINGDHTKPSHRVKIGEKVRVQRGLEEYTVTIQGISDLRGPAKVASMLYQETPDSVQKRELAALQRRTQPLPAWHHRPTKRDRRQLMRFLEGGEESDEGGSER